MSTALETAAAQIEALTRENAELRSRAGPLPAPKVTPGVLTEIIQTDRTGRKISRFEGDPECCWGPFKQPIRSVTGINR